MKKALIIFIGLITIFTVGCGHGSINEITFNDYEQMIENKESFILFIGSHNCSHCSEFKITLEDIIQEYKVDFKYLDVANLSKDEYKILSNNIIFEGTPTTVFIEDGKDNSCTLFSCDDSKRIEGALDYNEVVQILKNNGYIEG